MTYSRYTTDTFPTSDYSSRLGIKVDHFLVHHSADVNVSNVLDAMAPGGRTVTANYVIKDDRLFSVVDEGYRAFTSGSPDDGGKGAAWDRRSITVEVVNSKVGDPWPVSDESFDTLARLIADASTRYGFAITDDNVLTHQELWSRFQASYPTACPGDLQRRKAELLLRAIAFQRGDTAPTIDLGLLRRQKDDTMYVNHPANPSTVYAVTTGANNRPQMRVCGANEAAFALKGGLVIPAGADAAGGKTLEDLGREAGYVFGATEVIPTVKLTDK